jgi:hypothetical protein
MGRDSDGREGTALGVPTKALFAVVALALIIVGQPDEVSAQVEESSKTGLSSAAPVQVEENGGVLGLGVVLGGGGLIGGDLHLRFGRIALVGNGAWRPALLLLGPGSPAFADGEPFAGGGLVIYFTGDRARRGHHGLELRAGYGFRSEGILPSISYHVDIYINSHVAFSTGAGVGWVFNTSEDYAAEQFPEACGATGDSGDGGLFGSESECASMDGPILYWALGFRFYT